MTFRIDLPAKLSLVTLLWACAFLLPWEVQAALCLVPIAARFVLPDFAPLSARSSRAFSRFVLYSIGVTALVLFLNAILVRGDVIVGQWFGVTIYEEGFRFGARTASRLLLLSYSILGFFVSTPLKELINFAHLKGLPPSFSLILLLTLHFVDHLPGRIHQIFLAQQARGAPVDAGFVSRSRALLSILSPLVLSSIVESIERGTALELRGFMNRPQHRIAATTSTRSTSFFTLLFLLGSAALIIIAIAQWLIR